MNFLKGVRQKLSNVSDDISKTFRVRKEQDKQKQISIGDCSFLGGAQLLEKYQNDWFSIHDGNDHIIKTAIKIDGAIGKLHDYVTARNTQYTRMSVVVHDELPRLSGDLDAILGTLADLTLALDRCGCALACLEDAIEWCELREKEARLHSGLVEARRRSESLVESARVSKAREHAERVARTERKRQAEQRERSATFEEEFYRDLEHFRATGRVERTVSHTSASEDQLAEIEVAEDADAEALNDFLAEEAPSEDKTEALNDFLAEGVPSGDKTEALNDFLAEEVPSGDKTEALNDVLAEEGPSEDKPEAVGDSSCQEGPSEDKPEAVGDSSCQEGPSGDKPEAVGDSSCQEVPSGDQDDAREAPEAMNLAAELANVSEHP